MTFVQNQFIIKGKLGSSIKDEVEEYAGVLQHVPELAFVNDHTMMLNNIYAELMAEAPLPMHCSVLVPSFTQSCSRTRAQLKGKSTLPYFFQCPVPPASTRPTFLPVLPPASFSLLFWFLTLEQDRPLFLESQLFSLLLSAQVQKLWVGYCSCLCSSWGRKW